MKWLQWCISVMAKSSNEEEERSIIQCEEAIFVIMT